jgi:hypothetical protein
MSDLLRQTPSQKRQKSIGFLDLPGEIRNQIYDHYFKDKVRIELVAKGTRLYPKRSPSPSKQRQLTIRKPKLHNRKTLEKKGEYKSCKWESTFSALLLVCWQIYRETMPFHYNAAAFVFASTGNLRFFLKVIPTLNLTFITALELHHCSYGCPSQPGYMVWKAKYDTSWWNVCKAASLQLTGLKRLTLILHITEIPLLLEFHNNLWIAPLLHFRRLASPIPFEVKYDRVELDRDYRELIQELLANK